MKANKNKPSELALLSILEDQKNTLAELKKSREHYKTLFNLSPTGIILLTADGYIYDINEEFCRLSGYKKHELLGKHISLLSTGEAKKNIQSNIKKILSGQILEQVVKDRKKDGSEIIFELREKAIILPDGTKGILTIGRDVTKQIQAENALKQSEEKFRSLTELANAAVFIVKGSSFFYVNPAFLKITGYTKREIKKLQFWEIVHPADRETIKQRGLNRQKGMRITNRYEFRIINKSGEIKWVDFSAIKIDFLGTPALLGTAFDISERKIAEEKLKESELRYRTLFESANIGIGISSFDGKVISVNKAMTEIFGYNEEEFKTINVENAYKDKKQRDNILKRVLENGRVENIITQVKTKSGSFIWVNMSMSIITVNNEKLLLVFIADITKLKETEEKLFEQFQKNEKILSTSLDGFILADTSGNIVDVNKPYCDLVKYSREELLRMNIRAMEGKLNEEEIIKRIKRFTEQGYDRFETIHIDKYGNPIDLDVSISLMTFENKTYVAAFVRDISEQKKYLREISDSRAQLRMLANHLQSIREEEREAIARELHDELAQILSSIKMSLVLLSRDLPSKKSGIDKKLLLSEFKAMSKLIDSSIKQIRRIITELRPEVLYELGLIPSLNLLIDNFKKNTKIKCKVLIDISHNNFKREASIGIYRILQEALTNITRHSKAKNVNIIFTSKDNFISLSIIDDGIGIPEEKINSPNTFGLLGMRERAIALNGNLIINNLNGKGTLIELTLPLEAAIK